jgi:hypothetical protein
LRCCALFAALASVCVPLRAVHGAGALAVGGCAAFGYAFDYDEMSNARAAAMTKCSDGRCKVVVTMQRGCAAFAIDGRNACGPHGFATAKRLGEAENTAVRYCYKFGGKDCVIRAWACDGKG